MPCTRSELPADRRGASEVVGGAERQHAERDGLRARRLCEHARDLVVRETRSQDSARAAACEVDAHVMGDASRASPRVLPPAPMETRLGATRQRWSTPKGSLSLWKPARGIFVSRAEGHVDLVLADHIVSGGDAVIAADRRILAFHNFERLTSYDSAARMRLTTWAIAIRNEVDRAHFLAESKIVRMGLSVASIALLGMLVSHHDRESFERALFAAIDERRAPGPR